MRVIGIDPGLQTGIAVYHGGKLIELRTVTPLELLTDELEHAACLRPCRVVFEDSRLISSLYSGVGQNRGALAKIARNVGEIDAYCRMLVERCESLALPVLSISPKDKGQKLDAQRFRELTGWAVRCNQHERDAAMVAWRYRGSRNTRGDACV